MPLAGNSPTVDLYVPAQRVMEALGSTYNDKNFVLLLQCLNRLKGQVSTQIHTLFYC